ncbi:MAG: RCC1 domain-containing protein, partial [Candidatus Thorarchaeota archaeon]
MVNDKFGDPFKVKLVSCGRNHTMIIDMNNNLLSFGFNNYG